MDSSTLKLVTDALARYAALTSSEVEELVSHGEYKEYKKDEFLTSEGTVENYVYYIIEGIVRNNFVHKGEDLSLDFFFSGSFTNALMSYLLRTPTPVNVQALTHVKVLRFHHDVVERLYDRSLGFNKLGRTIIEGLYIRRTKRELSLISQTAKQRYNSLFEENPLLIARIPLKHLATYLGIKPETLSRIRGKG